MCMFRSPTALALMLEAWMFSIVKYGYNYTRRHTTTDAAINHEAAFVEYTCTITLYLVIVCQF